MHEMSAADGWCAIEVRFDDDLWFSGRDHATLNDLKAGATAVFAGCLVRHRKGGVSKHHGK